MTHREPVGDQWTVDRPVCIGLDQQCHTKRPEISPQEQVEGVEGVGATFGVFQVVLSPKLALWGELHSAVIEKAVPVDLAVVHEPGEVGVPEGLLVEEVVPEVVGLGLAAKDHGHHVGQGIA